MFGLSDRLKAAVNQIEATGSSLQARAIGQHSPTSNSHPAVGGGPSSPSTTSRPTSLPTTPQTENHAGQSGQNGQNQPSNVPNGQNGQIGNGGQAGQGVSPTRSTSGHYVSSTSALAENALSGLRKSFQFGSRTSMDGSSRPNSSGSMVGSTGPQELKDIPTSPGVSTSTGTGTGAGAGPSRPSSPARYLNLNATQFQVGSDPSSLHATPQLPRSPFHPHTRSPLPHLPQTANIDVVSDPSDPSTYPLPPSPTLSPTSHLTVSVPSSTPLYADPLGASPMVSPNGNGDRPDYDTPPNVTNPTSSAVTAEHCGVGLGMKGVDIKPESTVTAVKLASPSGENGKSPETNGDLSQQLAATERRYEDLSTRFTTLLTQKHNANRVIKELTPLEEGIQDHEALDDWIRMMKGKVDMITDEMKRLQDKIALQDSRMEELRDTHRLEGSSQGDLITKLRTQLSTAESNLAARSTESANATTLKVDLQKAQTQAKEEEEKRTKAISLLKTVRMKLVKVEKEKEEIEKDRAEERAERSHAREEVEKLKAEKEREVTALRKGFERELQGAKERLEKDLTTKKAAWELEMITTKATHVKELSSKSTKVTGLESIVKELNVTTQQQFEELQTRQAVVESSRSEMEALSNRTKELEFQLRELTERNLLLEDPSALLTPNRGRQALPGYLNDGARSVSPSSNRAGSSSAIEVQRLVAEAEARAEVKLSDLRNKIRTLEKERNDAEEEWATKLGERVRELEKLRRDVQEKEMEYAESLRTRRDKERLIDQGEEAKRSVEKEVRALKAQIEESKEDIAVAAEAERAAREELSAVQVQVSTLQTQLDEAKSYSTTLKSNNRTLREEMRKIQSSVQLMERSRNPGVGYWSSALAGQSSTGTSGGVLPPPRSGVTSPGTGTGPPTPTKARASMESSRDSLRTGQSGPHTETSSPAPSEIKDNKEEEEVNLEYLRNIILQFLEHKEMRPNLVRVLSVILRFTPQELRRLNSKLLS